LTTTKPLKNTYKRERISSSTHLSNPDMSSPGVAQLGGGPEVVRRHDGEEPAGDETTRIAIQIIEAVLARAELSAREKDAWKRVRKAVEAPAKGDAFYTREAIEGIRKGVLEIKDTLKQQQVPAGKPMSYAEAAKAWRGAGAAKEGPQGQRAGPTVLPVPARRQREVVVKPGKETIEQKNRNGKELVEQIQREGAREVVAARRLPSGDVVVTSETRSAREEIQLETSWLKAFGEGAKVKRHVYTVIAHGIRMAHINMGKQEAVIKEIYTQNRQLKEEVEILAVHWSKRSLKLQKRFAPLLIDVAEPEQANRLVDTGLIWDYQLHDCEPFAGDCKTTQCFKCFKYGHVARACGNTARCGFCAAPGHDTNDCLQKNNSAEHRCAVCASPEARHKAWAPNCPERQKQVARARLAYSQRPSHFQVRDNIAPRKDRQPAIQTAQTTPPKVATPVVVLRRPSSEGQTEDMEGVTTQRNHIGEKRAYSAVDSDSEEEVVVRQPPRGPGRPRWNSVAPEGSQDIAGLLMNIPSS
jgi:hypothetical protein